MLRRTVTHLWRGRRSRGWPHGGAVLALAMAAAACRTSGPGSDVPAAEESGGVDPRGSADVSLRTGVGHTATIDKVAIASDGSAAVTRDQIGGTRVWLALDGSVEPIVVPVQNPQEVSVARRSDGVVVVAAVDTAGGAQIYEVDADGRVVERGVLAPFQPLFALHALPGGERLLALHRDHRIRLVDAAGTELAVFESRNFRPLSLRVAADGKTFVAVIGIGGPSSEAELQRLSIVDDEKGPRIESRGSPVRVSVQTPIGDTTGVLSPDGRRFAAVDKPDDQGWGLRLVDLDEPDTSRRFAVTIPAHLVPNIGFVSRHELLVSANDGSISWLIDVKEDRRRARTSAPQDFANQGRAQALARGVQVVGHGTSLFVHNVVARSHRYLGYRGIQTLSVAISPSAEQVAWAYAAGSVFVESLANDGGPRVKLPTTSNLGATHVRFFDDEHLLVIDAGGGIELVRWRDGVVVGLAGMHGSIRALHFDPGGGRLLIERHSNDVRLFEVDLEGFKGPYIVADQSFRAGLLDAGAAGHDDAVMWTLDSANTLRYYGLEELRRDPSHAELLAKGEPLAEGKVAPLAIDRRGRRYGVRWNGSTMELFIEDGGSLKTASSPSGDISAIVPSPSGRRFVAIHQRGQSTSLSVHDSDDLEEQWSFSTGVFSNEVVWSPDGRLVGVAANTGSVILDAEAGTTVRRRCGIEFAALGAAPSTVLNGVNLRSVCEG